MREATAADLARIRKAVLFRDGCVKAALDHYRWVDLQPIDTYARAAFDAMEMLIREHERQRIADALAPLLAESRFLAEAAVTHSRQCDQAHAGCLAARVRETLGKISSGGGGER